MKYIIHLVAIMSFLCACGRMDVEYLDWDDSGYDDWDTHSDDDWPVDSNWDNTLDSDPSNSTDFDWDSDNQTDSNVDDYDTDSVGDSEFTTDTDTQMDTEWDTDDYIDTDALVDTDMDTASDSDTNDVHDTDTSPAQTCADNGGVYLDETPEVCWFMSETPGVSCAWMCIVEQDTYCHIAYARDFSGSDAPNNLGCETILKQLFPVNEQSVITLLDTTMLGCWVDSNTGGWRRSIGLESECIGEAENAHSICPCYIEPPF